MAANNLREAIVMALTDKNVDLTEDQIRRIEGELRDFFSHEVARAVGSPPTEGSESAKMEWTIHEIHLSSFVRRVFKDVKSG